MKASHFPFSSSDVMVASQADPMVGDLPAGVAGSVARDSQLKKSGLSARGDNTAAFAADSICSWWKHHGSKRYQHAKRILILADSGGSNRPASPAWHYHVWRGLCQKQGLKVTVCHYPTGASKWNPIEHRLFSEISKNWSGIPLDSIQKALTYVRTTKTKTGLRVSARLSRKNYRLKEKISDEQLSQISKKNYQLSPKLNYTLHAKN